MGGEQVVAQINGDVIQIGDVVSPDQFQPTRSPGDMSFNEKNFPGITRGDQSRVDQMRCAGFAIGGRHAAGG